MSMTRKQAIEAMVGRHREALAQSKNFRCCCCDGIYPSSEASHVAAYEASNSVMQRLVPGENIATYVVCKECADACAKTASACQKAAG